MTILAAVCGVLIVLLGFWSTGKSPSDWQFGIQVTCLVGGLILCFLAVVLSRLSVIAKRLDDFEAAADPGE